MPEEAKDGMVIFFKIFNFSKNFSFMTSLERGWVDSESPSLLKKLPCEALLKCHGSSINRVVFATEKYWN